MQRKVSNIFVKKILKNKGKILKVEQLKKMFFDLDENPSENKFYKKIYQLKNQDVLLSLKKDLFYIKKNDEELLDDVIEQKYWEILKIYLKENYQSNYFIGGVKALEIWNNNFSAPDKIVIVNPFKRSNEVLLKGKMIHNTIYTIKGLDEIKSFKFFKKYSQRTYVDGKLFRVANYELSLLESLYSPSFEEEKYIYELVKKNIRKNWKKINLEIIEDFLKYGKYGSSCKKLYDLALGIRPDFADKLKILLKKWYRL